MSEKIFVKIRSQIDPFRLESATITSPDLQYTWLVTDESFDNIMEILKFIESLPTTVKTALEIHKSRLNTDSDGSSLLTFKAYHLLRLGRNLTQTRGSTVTHLKQEVRNFLFTVKEKAIFQPAELGEESSHISFQDSIELMIHALETMAVSLTQAKHEMYLRQVRALNKVMDIMKIYSLIYLKFIHPVWSHATTNSSMSGIGLNSCYRTIRTTIQDLEPFSSSRIEDILRQNLALNRIYDQKDESQNRSVTNEDE